MSVPHWVLSGNLFRRMTAGKGGQNENKLTQGAEKGGGEPKREHGNVPFANGIDKWHNQSIPGALAYEFRLYEVVRRDSTCTMPPH
jgi:hypothetical protein